MQPEPSPSLRFYPAVCAGVLLFSFCCQLPAQEGYLDFNWDRVPLYAHVGLGRGLKPEEYKFLAEQYDFIAFTGGELDREYRSNDEITFETIVTEAARTVKKHNSRAKVLFYLAADFAKPHLKLSNAIIPEDGLIEVQRNARTIVQIFDTTNPVTRDWWTSVAARAVNEYGCDGIFVDGGTAFTPGSIYEQRLGKERNAALEEGMFAMLTEAKQKMGTGSLILLNPLHGPKAGQTEEQALGWRYLPFVDGAMVDDFDRAANILEKRQSPEYIAGTIRIMIEAAKRGEIVVFKAWPGFTWWSDKELMAKRHTDQYAVAVKNLEFPLACFLIGAEQHCYFCYSWGWLPEHGALDTFPEFGKSLGPPKGPAVQEGWTFRREFEHASVLVDVDARTASIAWREDLISKLPPGTDSAVFDAAAKMKPIPFSHGFALRGDGPEYLIWLSPDAAPEIDLGEKTGRLEVFVIQIGSGELQPQRQVLRGGGQALLPVPNKTHGSIYWLRPIVSK